MQQPPASRLAPVHSSDNIHREIQKRPHLVCVACCDEQPVTGQHHALLCLSSLHQGPVHKVPGAPCVEVCHCCCIYATHAQLPGQPFCHHVAHKARLCVLLPCPGHVPGPACRAISVNEPSASAACHDAHDRPAAVTASSRFYAGLHMYYGGPARVQEESLLLGAIQGEGLICRRSVKATRMLAGAAWQQGPTIG